MKPIEREFPATELRKLAIADAMRSRFYVARFLRNALTIYKGCYVYMQPGQICPYCLDQKPRSREEVLERHGFSQSIEVIEVEE